MSGEGPRERRSQEPRDGQSAPGELLDARDGAASWTAPLPRAARRGVVFSGILALFLVGLLIGAFGFAHGTLPRPGGVVSLVLLAFAFAPTIALRALVEATSRRGDLLTGAIAFATGLVGLLLGCLQVIYVDVGLGDPRRGLRSVGDTFKSLADHPGDIAIVAILASMLAAPLAAVTVTRRRKLSVGLQVLMGLVLTAALEEALFVLAGATRIQSGEAMGFAIAGVVLGVLLPVTERAVDLADARLLAWFRDRSAS